MNNLEKHNKIRLAFIVNPVSGVGRQKKVEKAVQKYLDKQRFMPEIIYSEYAGFITRFIKDNSNRYDGFVAVGGDGTINEAVQALVGKPNFLAIIPTGSGNGLARHLKIPLQVEKAVKKLNNATVKKIDVMQLGEYYSVNVSGCGFDAEIGWDFSLLEKRGLSSYIRLVSEKIWRYNPVHYTIALSGKEISGKAFIVSFANGSQYGNNAYVSPESDLQDGVFEVIVLKPFQKRFYPAVVTRFFTKTLPQSKFVEVFRSAHIKVKFNSGKIHIDGEPKSISPNKWITVTMLPKSLNVLV